MFRKFLLIALFSLLVAPAMAGDNLFPPDSQNIHPCDAGSILKWTGHSVECTHDFSTINSCNNGYVTGIVNGQVQCSSSGLCRNPTALATLSQRNFPWGPEYHTTHIDITCN